MLTNHEIGEVLELEVGPAFLPDFHRDDIACFTHIRPVLLAMGWMIEQYPYGTYVRREVGGGGPISVWECVGEHPEDGSPVAYSTALCDAITYAHEHRRDELVRAVEEVKHGALG